MKTILNRIDRLMIAITFAEANEPEIAQEWSKSRNQMPAKRAQDNTPITGGRIVPNQTAH